MAVASRARVRLRRAFGCSLVLVLAVLALVASGLAYEVLGRARDRVRFQRVGRPVDIGGRTLNLECSGEGSPTVILESAGGTPGYSWLQVARRLGASTRVCWYDRAGYGWSDPGPFPNHSDSVARDLHRLLATAAIRPPYVLVGESLGAFHVRVYNGLFPGEAVAMVLVDPMDEDTTMRVHNHDERLRPAVVRVFQLLDQVGWWRFWDPPPGKAPSPWTPAEWETLAAMRRRSIPSQPKETPLWVNGELARASGRLGELPLIVLSPGGAEGPGAASTGSLRQRSARQQALAALSSRGRQLVVPGGRPSLAVRSPAAVADAVRQVLVQATGPSSRADPPGSRSIYINY